jgi:osmoprotectant transport system permease protein
VGARKDGEDGRDVRVFTHVFHWFANAGHWSGSDGVLFRLVEHVEMTLLATAIGAAIALPVGLYIGHTRKGEFFAVSVANIGRALPSFGILGIVLPFTESLPGIGFYPTVIALVLLSIPPILTNTYIGTRNVDEDTVEAARGMGFSGRDILFKIRVPLAAPLIVGGLRTAVVSVVATATLAALVGWGGLGRFIIDGFAQGDQTTVIAGAILVAALAIVFEIAMAGVEKLVTPRQVSRGPRGRHTFETADLGSSAAAG